MQAGIYARISLDRKEGEGVARQIADCRALAADLGWGVSGEYVDNDVSAYSGKPRPEYRRMLDDLQSGAIGGVLAYHTDRLYRMRRDLAEFVDIIKACNAQVRTVKSGEVDLSTASGRLIAAQLGAIGIYESERIVNRNAKGDPLSVERPEVERLEAPRLVTAEQIAGSVPEITGDLTIDEFITWQRER